MNQAAAFALTLACEVPLVCWLLHMPAATVGMSGGCAAATASQRSSLAWTVQVAVAASAFTHPLAWYITQRLSPQHYGIGVWWVEMGVVLLEAMVFRLFLRLPRARALGVSLVANAFSMGVGWWFG